MTSIDDILNKDLNKQPLKELIGQQITVFCNYIYTGKLIAVAEYNLQLENPSIVYETGPFTEKEWKDSQPLNVKTWNIMLHAIESYGVLK